jgi:hypothetical protein
VTSTQKFLAAAMAGFFTASFASAGMAATLKSQVVGVWAIVSETETVDGIKSEPLGAHPVGLAIYDKNGYFSSQRMRADLPKFAARRKDSATDAENRAVVEGIQTLFGTYTIDEQTHTRVLHVVGSSFPNIAGLDLKEAIVIKGDLMTVTTGPTGNVTLVWKRLK